MFTYVRVEKWPKAEILGTSMRVKFGFIIESAQKISNFSTLTLTPQLHHRSQLSVIVTLAP